MVASPVAGGLTTVVERDAGFVHELDHDVDAREGLGAWFTFCVHDDERSELVPDVGDQSSLRCFTLLGP